MNWIAFSERKPKAEPVRDIMVWHCVRNVPGIFTSNQTHMWDNVTHWSEIEPPPKPDPFDQWLKPFLEANPNIGKINLADAAWYAAIKWKEGQK